MSGPSATTESSKTYSPSRTRSPRRSPRPCSAASKRRGSAAPSARPPENMAAYEYLLAGKILHHASKRESNAEALRNLDRAIAARSRLCARSRLEGLRASVRPGCTIGARTGPQASERSSTELQTALALDDNDADVHRILAALKLNFNEHDKAVLSSGARAEPQSEQRPHRRPAGRALDLARPTRRGDRMGSPRDAPQSLPSRTVLEPSWPGPVRRPRLWRRNRVVTAS